MMQPVRLNTFSVPPATFRPSIPPASASGTVSRMMNGWMKLSNCAASTKKQISSASRKLK